MKLSELLRDAEPIGPVPDVEVGGIEYDSRRIKPGDVFFAFPGAVVDGHDFIPQARAAGAAAIVSERPAPTSNDSPWARVQRGRRALARAAAAFYRRPDRDLKLIGVTGTNGKTTTVFLIDSMLRRAGFKTARLGTIAHRVGDREVAAVNTTPESLDLTRLFAELRDAGGTHACLECSSHALELERIYGFEFHTAVFTNLSQDHLDFHPDMGAYARAKRRLFEGAGARPPLFGAINLDDETGRSLLALEGFEAISYGRAAEAVARLSRLEASLKGLDLTAATPRGEIRVRSRLRGAFNASNILAAIAAGLALGLDLQTTRSGIEDCAAVPGRFEAIDEGLPFLTVVDYAHTDDALRNVIQAARDLLAPGGRVITVFGCGGDRDRAKRPRMGEAAGRLSDRVIVTSDNPRGEEPLRIIADAEVGLQRVEADYAREPDRRKAIAKALGEARAGDVVLIAGKGHETYQQVGKEKTPFDDREVARESLRELRGGRPIR